MGRVLLEQEKVRKKTKRRKRKRASTSSSESGDWSDIDGELGESGQDGDGPFWTYDLLEMCTKPEFNHSDTVKSMTAKEFTFEYFRQSGLKEPLLFADPPAQLGMRMPKASKFSVQSVKNLIGGDRIIEVIEVNTQGSRQMSLDEFVKYYRGDAAKRATLLNVLSLEFSMTPLGEKVLSPALVRQVDWVELYWPKELRCIDDSKDDQRPLFPKVQHYCLMSVKECFTDFHVDFGGTSVWYHVLKGKKIFWMIEPTEHNLVLYEKWILEGNNNVFFGDVVEKCARVELSEGNTFIIPSGWIHAVYTPVDSLVFGGNFMHSFSIPMQLRVRLSEDRIKVAKKFRYPFFNEMLWYVIEGVVRKATGQTFLKPIVSPQRRLRSRPSDRASSQDGSGAVDESEQQLPSAVEGEVNHLEAAMLAAMCSGLQPESEEEPLRIEAASQSEGNEAENLGNAKEKQEKCRKEECIDVDSTNEAKSCEGRICEVNESGSEQEQTNGEKQGGGEGNALENGLYLKNEDAEIEPRKEDAEIEPRKENAEIEPRKEDAEIEPKKDAEIEPRKEDAEIEPKKEDAEIEPKKEGAEIEAKKADAEIEARKEEMSANLKEESDAPKESEEQSAEVKKEEDVPDVELTFDDTYLATLTEIERNGYRELLVYMRKSMRFHSKMEEPNTITDPFKLLSVFEAVLNHEVDKEKLSSVPTNEQPAETTSQGEEVTSSSQQKQRERKRKISTVSTKKEKAHKPPKSKHRKSEPGHHFEGPLIVGGLPPAIMPADAPQAPNPYGYDPLAAVTPLGHKQLPSAYRRTADMAKAPPSQKYRLQPLRQPVEAQPEAKAQSEGDDAKLGPLRVDTGEAIASTSKSPIGSANATKECVKDGMQAVAVANVRRRISEPSTSAAVRRDEHSGTSSGRPRQAHDERSTTATHHKASCPELEYRSPLARTYPAQVSPKTAKLEENSWQRANRRSVGTERSRRRYTDGASRSKPILDSASSASEKRPSQGSSSHVGWHMAAPPPPWAPQQPAIRQQQKPPSVSVGPPPLRWPPPVRVPTSLYAQEMFVRGYDARQPRAGTSYGGFVPLVAPLPQPSSVQSSATSLQTVASAQRRVGGTQWAQLARQEVVPPRTDSMQSAASTVLQPADQRQPSPGSLRREEPVITESRHQAADVSAQTRSERADIERGFQHIQEVQGTGSVQGDHRAKEESRDAGRKLNETPIGGGYTPTPISDLPPRSDELLGIPVIQFERDSSVMGILKRRTAVVPSNATSSNSSPASAHSATESATSATVALSAGASLQPPSESTDPSDLSREVVIPKANLERGRRLSEAREQFPMGPPKLIEPKLASDSTKNSRAVPEPVDYVTAINELAKLVDEVNEDSGVKPVAPVTSLSMRRSDSSSVLCDPRRAKREPVVVEANSEASTEEKKKEADPSDASSTPQKAEELEEASRSALLDDLSFLTAEYNALGE